jgi:hypothetical protein
MAVLAVRPDVRRQVVSAGWGGRSHPHETSSGLTAETGLGGRYGRVSDPDDSSKTAHFEA